MSSGEHPVPKLNPATKHNAVDERRPRIMRLYANAASMDLPPAPQTTFGAARQFHSYNEILNQFGELHRSQNTPRPLNAQGAPIDRSPSILRSVTIPLH